MRAIRIGVFLAVAIAGRCLGGWIVDGTPSHWEGVPAGASADEYTFPVLVLPLGGQWTDFELKATTNNFTNLCYYIKSSGTNGVADDTNVWVYFTDDYTPDVRQWHRAVPGQSIGSQVVDPVRSEVEFAVVMPSHQCVGDWQEWMSPTNNRLVWSFVRYDGIGLEMNATGTKTHWNPVVPVEWRTARTAP